MLLPENGRKYTKPDGKSSVLMFLILVTAMLFIALLVYLKTQNIQLKDFDIGDLANVASDLSGHEIQVISDTRYESGEQPIFCTYKEGIVKYSNNTVQVLDLNGEERWTAEADADSPILKSSGSFLLIADMGGKSIHIIDGKDKIKEIVLDNVIVNADINEDGYVSVAHKAKGHKGAVSVFDPDGERIFTYYLAERYVISAKVSPSGKQLIINSLDTSGLNSSSVIEFTDMRGNPTGSKYVRENEVCPQVWFIGNSVVSVSDSSIVSSSKDTPEEWKQDFESKSILASGTSNGKYIAVAILAGQTAGIFNRDTDINLFSQAGKLLHTYKVNGVVKSLTASDDYIAANIGREVYFIDIKGKLKSKYTSKAAVQEIHFINSYEAVVISKENITVVKI